MLNIGAVSSLLMAIIVLELFMLAQYEPQERGFAACHLQPPRLYYIP